MTSIKTPNFVITQMFVWCPNRLAKTIELPAGSFVRPIEYQYVPKHVTEAPVWQDFDKNREVFCYTRFGIIALPKNILREV
jgi:hypothetical protein